MSSSRYQSLRSGAAGGLSSSQRSRPAMPQVYGVPVAGPRQQVDLPGTCRPTACACRTGPRETSRPSLMGLRQLRNVCLVNVPRSPNHRRGVTHSASKRDARLTGARPPADGRVGQLAMQLCVQAPRMPTRRALHVSGVIPSRSESRAFKSGRMPTAPRQRRGEAGARSQHAPEAGGAGQGGQGSTQPHFSSKSHVVVSPSPLASAHRASR